MRAKFILMGLVIGAAGYAIQYYTLFSNQYISYGVIGAGILLILAGLVMRPRI